MTAVAVDPHKWLYAPLEAGCVLVRGPRRLRGAFTYTPSYYHPAQGPTNFNEPGPQNSRGFRALKVWLALRQVGREGYVRMIQDDRAVGEHPELEAYMQALSINTFRYVPRDLSESRGRPETEAYLDRLNQALLERIQRSGRAFVSNAVLRGRHLLPAWIVNFHTTEADTAALPGIVAELGREVDATLRRTISVGG